MAGASGGGEKDLKTRMDVVMHLSEKEQL
uniref:Uncharacterized protein n=1 Tax=Arundo donax TaxID=35708 RepID=A0A0A9G1Z3_ARUDO